MNGELAQRIALVLHGNAFLAGRATPDIDSASVFQYVRWVKFVSPARSRFRRPAVVDSASGWFQQLRKHGATRLELDCVGQLARPASGPLPTHISVAFVGGERAPILAQYAAATDVWRAAWRVADGERPADNRIWEVSYAAERLPSAVTASHPTLEAAAAELDLALQEAETFAGPDLGHWGPWMTEARHLLVSGTPDVPYHPDLAPPDIEPAAARLLAGAVKAYVFGGMGSWNDMGFAEPERQKVYDDVTRQLYQAVLYAFDAAANTGS